MFRGAIVGSTGPIRAGVLFPEDDCVRLREEMPEVLRDLNLDQVIAALIAGREEYELAAYFQTPLPTPEAVAHRQDVLADLEDPALLAAVAAFADAMREVRRLLERAGRRGDRNEADAWFLQGVETYCEAVGTLAGDLGRAALRSRALIGLRDGLRAYLGSRAFEALAHDARSVREALSEVRYRVNVRGNRVTVSRSEEEADFTTEVRRTFARFAHRDAADHRVQLRIQSEMDHVEAQVLDLVARLHPGAFDALHAFRGAHAEFVAEFVARFDREVQFYLAYLDYTAPLRTAGLPLCRPQVSRAKDVQAVDSYDLALAHKLIAEEQTIVRNDVRLAGRERVIVVTGPNQGGKTTFARMVGQLHHLAALGLTVPGSEARLHLYDRLFTHFEREEVPESGSGKLEDDLLRIHAILDEATADSVLILNESFGSTTLHDATALGTAVLEQVIGRDALCVYVTFVDELASLADSVVSMVGGVSERDPATRTYRIERRAPDGLAYARILAERHGLSPRRIRKRVAA